MWDFCEETHPKARKDYPCDATYFIDQCMGWDLEEFEPEFHRSIVKARSEGFKIVKGSEYIKVKGMFDGEFITFRARKDMDRICCYYDLYGEY